MPDAIDPNVSLPNNESPVPPAVAAAARAAEALHAQVYATPQAPAPQPLAPIAPQAPQPPAAIIPETGPNGSWEHRFLAMEGRYKQVTQDNGQLQQLLGDMGNELAQTRQLLRPAPAAPAPARRTPPQKSVTAEDEARYGPELLGLIQRAARDVVAPTMDRYAKQAEALTQQLIAPLQERVERTATATIYQLLDSQMPEWRTINNDQRFKKWVRLQDVYSGVVRDTLLQDAFQAADAPRVVSFFKGFLAEEQATGNQPVLPQAQPAFVPPQPAYDPLLLAAPGRHKPAGGEPPLVADKPVFTRQQISKFYDDVRRGSYAAHEQLRMNTEAQIFAAQREGRIR